MQSRILFVALFLGFVALVSASVVPIQKRSFKVERSRNPGFTGRDGPRALARVYRKFGMPLPQGLVDTLAAQDAANRRAVSRHTARSSDLSRRGLLDCLGQLLNGGSHHTGQQKGQNSTAGSESGANATKQTGSVINVPANNDAEFLSPVSIGGQTLNLDFDTGSSDLWVFNTQLSAAVSAGHTVFDPAQSKTFSPIKGAQFLVTYGDGSGAEGNVGTDVVDVGGAAVQNQAVELATAVTQEFAQDQNNDGLMGLAFSKLNTVKPQQQKTFFENVMGSLSEPVFTADLRKNATGAYEFGSIDSSKFTGELAWIPVNSTQGFWQFSSEKFAVNGGQAQEATAGGQAIADTGTTLILADPAVVAGYYSQVQGAQNDTQVGGMTVPCDGQLPDLELDIGGVYMARVRGEDLNFSQLQGNNTCFGGLQATTVGGLGVYGDVFFKSQFVVFNGGNNTLGMADHA